MFCAIRADAASIIFAIQLRRPAPLRFRLPDGLEDALGALHFVWRGREDVIGQVDLRRMDGPLPLDAERCRATGGEREARRILEVAERSVDRPQPVGAAGHRHARDRGVPLVTGVVGIEAPDAHGAGAHAGGVVGHAEVHRLEPRARLRDRLDVRHPERRLDQDLETDPTRKALRRLDLREQRVHQVYVGWHAHFRNEHRVQPIPRRLDHIHHVAVHVVGVDAVDAERDGLSCAAPVDRGQRLDHMPARRLLVQRRHGILEVEKDVVRATLGRLLEQLRARAGHRELAAVQSRVRRLIARVTHRAATAAFGAAAGACASGERGAAACGASNAAVLRQYSCAAAHAAAELHIDPGVLHRHLRRRRVLRAASARSDLRR